MSDGSSAVCSSDLLCNAAASLKAAGAEGVVAYCTHGVLSGGAVARVEASELTELVITDSIQPTDAVHDSARVRALTVAPLLGEAIKRIADETSVSSLFRSEEHTSELQSLMRISYAVFCL